MPHLAQARTPVLDIAYEERGPADRSARVSVGHHRYFTGPDERRLLENVGHNPPQEAPHLFAEAVMAAARLAA